MRAPTTLTTTLDLQMPPFPDLDCVHWLDACEPEDSDSPAEENLDEQHVSLLTSEAA